jgi:hypothetical protein
MRPRFVFATLIVLLGGPAHAEGVVPRGPAVVFAPAEQGRKILAAPDDFVERQSAFDRAARMKTDREVSRATYLAFVGTNVLDWNASDKALVGSAIANVQPRLDALALQWPQTIYLIKTSGNEEGKAAYTRDNAIVLPVAELAEGKAQTLRKGLVHELFHVLTRKNPALKEELYAAIGFQPCGEVEFPSKLTRITNPDAPKNDHCLRVTIASKPTWVVPILFAQPDKYDPAKGGEFFSYLQFRLLVVKGEGVTAPSNATYDDANVRLVDVADAKGFFEQVGRNTRYIIHPEEILADNFSLLVLGAENVTSPEILAKMRDVLRRARATRGLIPVDRRRGAPSSQSW